MCRRASTAFLRSPRAVPSSEASSTTRTSQGGAERCRSSTTRGRLAASLRAGMTTSSLIAPPAACCGAAAAAGAWWASVGAAAALLDRRRESLPFAAGDPFGTFGEVGQLTRQIGTEDEGEERHQCHLYEGDADTVGAGILDHFLQGPY
mgnify:CR=1 FL=1